ncbi:hypothetical protein BRO54_3151 [Geobacillus proteiniphilus]|uniref:Uncharacterized protein n=2 Tax=Geobacillus TaxID=129337 RepID=A0A1Q5SQE5_9BACL|nr:hypothetical protein BRO54_3151 [Geobacillus proteiniphilus]
MLILPSSIHEEGDNMLYGFASLVLLVAAVWGGAHIALHVKQRAKTNKQKK